MQCRTGPLPEEGGGAAESPGRRLLDQLLLQVQQKLVGAIDLAGVAGQLPLAVECGGGAPLPREEFPAVDGTARGGIMAVQPINRSVPDSCLQHQTNSSRAVGRDASSLSA